MEREKRERKASSMKREMLRRQKRAQDVHLEKRA